MCTPKLLPKRLTYIKCPIQQLQYIFLSNYVNTYHDTVEKNKSMHGFYLLTTEEYK